MQSFEAYAQALADQSIDEFRATAGRQLDPVFVLAVCRSFPVMCWIAILATGSAFGAERFNRVSYWASFPFISIVIGGLALAWISWFQGGRFAG